MTVITRKSARRKAPRVPDVVPDIDLHGAARQPCVCEQAAPRQHRPCAACQAWEHGRVLLTTGDTVTRQRWLTAYEVPRAIAEKETQA